MRGPRGVRENRVVVGARLSLVVLESASDEGPTPERREERRSDRQRAQLFRLALGGEVDASHREQRGVLEGGRLGFPVDVIGNRDRCLGQADERIPVPDEHEPVGIAVRQRAEQDPVQEAEDGGVGADAERQCQHGDGRKNGLLAERADRVPDVSHIECWTGTSRGRLRPAFAPLATFAAAARFRP
jgi:hypothetical protein